MFDAYPMIILSTKKKIVPRRSGPVENSVELFYKAGQIIFTALRYITLMNLTS